MSIITLPVLDKIPTHEHEKFLDLMAYRLGILNPMLPEYMDMVAAEGFFDTDTHMTSYIKTYGLEPNELQDPSFINGLSLLSNINFLAVVSIATQSVVSDFVDKQVGLNVGVFKDLSSKYVLEFPAFKRLRDGENEIKKLVEIYSAQLEEVGQDNVETVLKDCLAHYVRPYLSN